MSYLNFVDCGTSPSGKTRMWQVQNISQGVVLGWVKWYAPWRKYVVDIASGLFDPDCLDEISKFARSKTQEHRGDKEE